MIDASIRRTARQLAALGDPHRLRIVRHLLLHGPAHVTALADAIGVVMANVSHHLGVLRAAGILTDAKAGRKVIYSVSPAVLDPVGRDGALAVLVVGTMRVVFNRDAA